MINLAHSFDRKAIRLLRRAERIVRALPDSAAKSGVLRCHEVARAVGQVLELPVQDGQYGMVEHSWLWVLGAPKDIQRSNYLGAAVLLDVYTCGRLPQVQLVDMWALLPESRSYKWDLVGESRSDIRDDVVKKLVRAARRSLRPRKVHR